MTDITKEIIKKIQKQEAALVQHLETFERQATKVRDTFDACQVAATEHLSSKLREAARAVVEPEP